MGPEENWQMKVTLPPHTLLPPLNLSSALTLQPLTSHTFFFFPQQPSFVTSNSAFSQLFFCTGVRTCPFCFAHSDFSPPDFLFPPPPSPSRPSAAAEQWADVWQSLLLFLSHTHTNPVLPAPALLGQCLLSPLHSEWLFSTALVCASLLLYSGFKSAQFVLSMIDYFVCSFCIAIKAVRKH